MCSLLSFLSFRYPLLFSYLFPSLQAPIRKQNGDAAKQRSQNRLHMNFDLANQTIVSTQLNIAIHNSVCSFHVPLLTHYVHSFLLLLFFFIYKLKSLVKYDNFNITWLWDVFITCIMYINIFFSITGMLGRLSFSSLSSAACGLWIQTATATTTTPTAFKAPAIECLQRARASAHWYPERQYRRQAKKTTKLISRWSV